MSNKKGRGQNVNKAELADIMGVAMPTIDDWVRRGCPVTERGGKGKAWVMNTADVRAWRDDDIRRDAASDEDTSIEELKRRKLRAETVAAELDLAIAKGQVAPLAQMERGVVRAFEEVKAALRNVPSRASRMIVGETDETRIRTVLLAEIDQALVVLDETDLISADDIGDPAAADG